MKVKVSIKEYNEWKASVESLRAKDTLASERPEKEADVDKQNQDGPISPLYDDALTSSSSASRRNSLDELISGLVDDLDHTTYELLLGNSSTNFSRPSTTEINTSFWNQSKVSVVPPKPPESHITKKDTAANMPSTSVPKESQIRQILSSMQPPSLQIQKKENKKKGKSKKKKNHESPLLMLMRAAQQYAPNKNLVFPIGPSNTVPLSSSPPPQTKPAPPLPPILVETEQNPSTIIEENIQQKNDDTHVEMPMLSSPSPPLGPMVEPSEVIPPRLIDEIQTRVSVSSPVSVVDSNERKISSASLSSEASSSVASSSLFSTEEIAALENTNSHNAPVPNPLTASIIISRAKLFSSPEPHVSNVNASGGEGNELVGKRNVVSLIPPASFVIQSLAPLYKEYYANSFKALLQKNTRLPSFHTIKKRRLPRSVFMEVGGSTGVKRYKIEGDAEDEENMEPNEEDLLALIRKKRNALYSNMFPNRFGDEQPLQLKYPHYPGGTNAPQFQQQQQPRFPMSNMPIMHTRVEPDVTSLQQRQQNMGLTYTTPPRSLQTQLTDSQKQSLNFQPQQQQLQNISPLQQQLSRSLINANDPRSSRGHNNLNNFVMSTGQASSAPPPNVQIRPSSTPSADNAVFKVPYPVVSRPTSVLPVVTSPSTSTQQQPKMQESFLKSSQFQPQSQQQQQVVSQLHLQQGQFQQQEQTFRNPFQLMQSSQTTSIPGQQFVLNRASGQGPLTQQQQYPFGQQPQQQQRYPGSEQYLGSPQYVSQQYAGPGQYGNIANRPRPFQAPYSTAGQVPVTQSSFQNRIQQPQEVAPQTQQPIVPSPNTSQTPTNRFDMRPYYAAPVSSTSSGMFYENSGEGSRYSGGGINQQPSVRIPSPYTPQQQQQTQQPLYQIQNRLYDDTFSKGPTTGEGRTTVARPSAPSYTTIPQRYPTVGPANLNEKSLYNMGQQQYGQHRTQQEGYVFPAQQQQWSQSISPFQRQLEQSVGQRAQSTTVASGPQQKSQYYGRFPIGHSQGNIGTFQYPQPQRQQQGAETMGGMGTQGPRQSQIQQQASEQQTQSQLNPFARQFGGIGGGFPYMGNTAQQRLPTQQAFSSNTESPQFNTNQQYFSLSQQQLQFSNIGPVQLGRPRQILPTQPQQQQYVKTEQQQIASPQQQYITAAAQQQRNAIYQQQQTQGVRPRSGYQAFPFNFGQQQVGVPRQYQISPNEGNHIPTVQQQRITSTEQHIAPVQQPYIPPKQHSTSIQQQRIFPTQQYQQSVPLQQQSSVVSTQQQQPPLGHHQQQITPPQLQQQQITPPQLQQQQITPPQLQQQQITPPQFQQQQITPPQFQQQQITPPQLLLEQGQSSPTKPQVAPATYSSEKSGSEAASKQSFVTNNGPTVQSIAQAGSPQSPFTGYKLEKPFRTNPEVISGGERVLFRSKPGGPKPPTSGSGGPSDAGRGGQGSAGAREGRVRGEFTLPIIDNPQEKSKLQKQLEHHDSSNKLRQKQQQQQTLPVSKEAVPTSQHQLLPPPHQSAKQQQQQQQTLPVSNEGVPTSQHQLLPPPHQSAKQQQQQHQFAPSHQSGSAGQQFLSSNAEGNKPNEQEQNNAPKSAAGHSANIGQPTRQQQRTPANKQSVPQQPLANIGQQQPHHQLPVGGYGRGAGGNVSIAREYGTAGLASGKPQHLSHTGDRGHDTNIRLGNSTAWGSTGNRNDNGGGGNVPQPKPQTKVQAEASKGTQEALGPQGQRQQQAQIGQAHLVGKHLPHHGGDMPFYSQSQLDAHHQRVSHNSQTTKDTEFENDSAILSWYLQRAKQELRHRQESGWHRKPQEETRARTQAIGFGSASQQPAVRSSAVQSGHPSTAQFSVTHPHSGGTSANRSPTPGYNAQSAAHPSPNSSPRGIRQVPASPQMVQTPANSQKIYGSAASSGHQSHANQNGLSQVPRKDSRFSSTPASPTPFASPVITAVHGDGPHTGVEGGGTDN